jgi:Activator of Hsp90 ATPase homolog 1-like protein
MSQVQEATESSPLRATEPGLPVRKNVCVRASAARAFKVFTEGLDTWWPKTHHIGSSPITRGFMEGRVGGRCYSEQADGTECQWGQIVVWEPPTRFVMAWQVTPDWKFEPDLSKCSEIEVGITPCDDGTTWVELEHRHFERQGQGGDAMRKQVGAPGGWSQLMELFRAKAEEEQA